MKNIENVAAGEWKVINDAGGSVGKVLGGRGYYKAFSANGTAIGDAETKNRAAQIVLDSCH